MLGDSAYDISTGTTTCWPQVVPIAPYNPRNTDNPLDIEYRVEDQIEEDSEDVQLKQSILDETYNQRTGVERTNDAVKDCGLARACASRPRPCTNRGIRCLLPPACCCDH